MKKTHNDIRSSPAIPCFQQPVPHRFRRRKAFLASSASFRSAFQQRLVTTEDRFVVTTKGRVVVSTHGKVTEIVKKGADRSFQSNKPQWRQISLKWRFARFLSSQEILEALLYTLMLFVFHREQRLPVTFAIVFFENHKENLNLKFFEKKKLKETMAKSRKTERSSACGRRSRAWRTKWCSMSRAIIVSVIYAPTFTSVVSCGYDPTSSCGHDPTLTAWVVATTLPSVVVTTLPFSCSHNPTPSCSFDPISCRNPTKLWTRRWRRGRRNRDAWRGAEKAKRPIGGYEWEAYQFLKKSSLFFFISRFFSRNFDSQYRLIKAQQQNRQLKAQMEKAKNVHGQNKDIQEQMSELQRQLDDR